MNDPSAATDRDASEHPLGPPSSSAEQLYVELFENTQVGICISKPAGALVACNPGFARMFGFASVQEAIDTDMTSLYAEPGDRQRFLEAVRRCRRLDHYRGTLRRRDGRIIHVLTSVVGQFDARGELVEIRGYLLDITASVVAETALAERERLFRAVFYGASDAMLILDQARVITQANPAGVTLFGTATEDLVGKVIDHFFVDGCESLVRAWPEVIARGEVRRELRVKGSAEPRLVDCSFRARVQDDRHLCIARDITERRLLEDRLAQAARIESVGRLAGGIAHDFNNLLTAILGYTELLLANRRPGDPERDDLEEIQKAGRRASALTQQLLAFGRKQLLQPQELDLNRTVAGLQPMLQRVLREDITLRVDSAPSPALVTVDASQIEQAILNLVLNARDALPMGGSVRLELKHVIVVAADLPSGAPGSPGPHVRLSVIDNGTGIPPSVREHLFEPFFTTKELGKGTGLGLASVHGIVHQSGGFIVVDCPPSGGSIFALHFPAVEPPTAKAGAAAGVHETILLVEDEDSVRVIVGAVLRRQGYRVLEAATPAGATEVFDTHRDQIDLLLTDVIMPGMNGPALAQRLVGRKPELRVLFMSGYADASSLPRLGGPNVAFLGKPFQSGELRDAVREVLDRPRV